MKSDPVLGPTVFIQEEKILDFHKNHSRRTLKVTDSGTQSSTHEERGPGVNLNRNSISSSVLTR